MIELCLIGVLIGVVSASSFDIIVLLSLVVVMALMLGGFVALGRLSLGGAMISFLCWTSAVQLGYAVSLIIQAFLARPRDGQTLKAGRPTNSLPD